MLEQYETILVPEEICEILRIGQNEVYKMLKNKEIVAYKVGKTWRIPKENVIQYIKSKIPRYTKSSKPMSACSTLFLIFYFLSFKKSSCHFMGTIRKDFTHFLPNSYFLPSCQIGIITILFYMYLCIRLYS